MRRLSSTTTGGGDAAPLPSSSTRGLSRLSSTRGSTTMYKLVGLLMPTEYFEVREATEPRVVDQPVTMWLCAACTYSLVALCFVSLMVLGLTQTDLVERIEDRDRSTSAPLDRRRGWGVFVEEARGRRRCDMLLRLSDSFAFESEDVRQLADADRADYAYHLARVKELMPDCVRDLSAARLGHSPCEDRGTLRVDVAEVSRAGSSVAGGAPGGNLLGMPYGVAADTPRARDDDDTTNNNAVVYVYARSDETMWRYSVDDGRFEVVFSDPNKVAIADGYGIAVLDDGTGYLTCGEMPSATDYGSTGYDDDIPPQCGLLRFSTAGAGHHTYQNATTAPAEQLAEVHKSIGATPTHLVAHGDDIYIADPAGGAIWHYAHPSPIPESHKDEVAPVRVFETGTFSAPYRLAASETYLWILDDVRLPKIHRCAFVGETTSSSPSGACERVHVDNPFDLFEAIEIAPRPGDAGVYVFIEGSVALKVVDVASNTTSAPLLTGTVTTLAAGPDVVAGGASNGDGFAAAVSGDTLYYVATGADDAALSRFPHLEAAIAELLRAAQDDDEPQQNGGGAPPPPQEGPEGEPVRAFDVDATWFACDAALLPAAEVPPTFADMLDVADDRPCKRAGLAFQASYALAFFNESDAHAYAREAAQADCAALAAPEEICDALQNQPPYLCEYSTKAPLYDVLGNAIANTELLFLAAIFCSAAVLTCYGGAVASSGRDDDDDAEAGDAAADGGDAAAAAASGAPGSGGGESPAAIHPADNSHGTSLDASQGDGTSSMRADQHQGRGDSAATNGAAASLFEARLARLERELLDLKASPPPPPALVYAPQDSPSSVAVARRCESPRFSEV